MFFFSQQFSLNFFAPFSAAHFRQKRKRKRKNDAGGCTGYYAMTLETVRYLVDQNGPKGYHESLGRLGNQRKDVP